MHFKLINDRYICTNDIITVIEDGEVTADSRHIEKSFSNVEIPWMEQEPSDASKGAGLIHTVYLSP